MLQLCFLKRDQNALKVIGVSGTENHGNSLSAIEFINQEMNANKFRLTNLFSVGDFSRLQLKQQLTQISEQDVARGAAF